MRSVLEQEKLMENIKAGDSGAFEELFVLYKDRVFNTALGYVHNKEDAEEITQDVFVEVHRSINKFKGKSGIGTWIYRITVNKSLDLIKHRKRKKRFAFITSLFDSESGEVIHQPVEFNHPGVEAEHREISKYLFEAINKLPDNQKTVFILFETEGLSHAEIGKVVNKSAKAVESLLRRAKENLRTILSDVYDRL
jgi:RNA polymerase sigma factor (sigma-70 family)